MRNSHITCRDVALWVLHLIVESKGCSIAAATIAGIETAHMIRKGRFGATDLTAFQQFAQLAA